MGAFKIVAVFTSIPSLHFAWMGWRPVRQFEMHPVCLYIYLSFISQLYSLINQSINLFFALKQTILAFPENYHENIYHIFSNSFTVAYYGPELYVYAHCRR